MLRAAFTHLFLYLYILLTRWRTRRRSLQTLIQKQSRKGAYRVNLPGLPEDLDDISEIPDDWASSTSFHGFCHDDSHISVHVTDNRRQFDLFIPGIGKIHYAEEDRISAKVGNINFTTKKRLQVYQVDPMRSWRLHFVGPVTIKDPTNSSAKTVHGILSLYWKCTTDPFDYWVTTPAWTLSRDLKNISLKRALSILNSGSIWFEQWGELNGRFETKSLEQPIKLTMQCCREKHITPIQCEERTVRVESEYIKLDDLDHTFVHKTVSCGNETPNLSNPRSGSSIDNGETFQVGFQTFCLGEHHSATREVKKDLIESKAFGQTYGIVTSLKTKLVWDNSLSTHHCRYKVNEQVAYGILVSTNRLYTDDGRTPLSNNRQKMNRQPKNDTYVLPLTNEICMERRLVGGKGSQLCALKALEFNVPDGFCITAVAYNQHLRDHPKAEEAVKNIEDTIRDNVDDLQSSCQRAAEILRSTEIAQNLHAGLVHQLAEMYGENEKVWNSKPFAVRSSAIDEDGEESSGAGMLDTYLGVRGLPNIVEAIQKCWASNVLYSVVEYRRQNGQPVLTSMGVVIQEMVEADTAGVLFTAEPLSGNDMIMVINASFGLGESVVSGKAEPDMIKLRKDDTGAVTIVEKHVGRKNIKINMKSEGGIIEAQTCNGNKLCLTDAEIYMICSVGALIEQKLGCSQDIEWAIQGNTVYVLQSRPITTLTTETDDDFLREFDTPSYSSKVLLTTCNIQEMMPGTVTPLTSDLFGRAVNDAFIRELGSSYDAVYSRHALLFLTRNTNSFCINLMPAYFSSMLSLEGSSKSKPIMDAIILGGTCHDCSVDDIWKYHERSVSIWRRMKAAIHKQFIHTPTLKKNFLKWKDKVDQFSIGKSASTAEELFDVLDDNSSLYWELWEVYAYATRSVSIILTLVMLKGDEPDMTTEINADLALLLSKCTDVYSADVPVAVERLAKELFDSELSETFANMSTEKCIEAIQTAGGNLQTEYKKFMKRHGHRGIREMEFMEKSWEQDPTSLVQSLKAMLKHRRFQETDRKQEDADKLIGQLKRPLTTFQKCILKFLLRGAMQCVQSREFGKSLAVKMSDAFKQAYWRLAKMMTKESRLPEEKLLFFLTHREIGELIKSRSAVLVRKAKRRMKVYEHQKQIRYQRVSFGKAKQIEITANNPADAPVSTITGMPVGLGKTSGRACVVRSLDDAVNIQKGDILISRITDVGWSPYFPLIGGLVTEIGGIISHGAVVAREYGIPCIVNAPNATELLKTGDMIRIDGAKGLIEKL